ncbi:MAG: hypothetical protein K6G26_09140, partial [Lachnospiraceae bacterium]|nr:hypothetical protein [Lachnospiraceae bacterium]
MNSKKLVGALVFTLMGTMMIGCSKKSQSVDNNNSAIEKQEEDEKKDTKAELVDISKFDSIDYGNDRIGSVPKLLDINDFSYVYSETDKYFKRTDYGKIEKIREEVFKIEYNDLELGDLDEKTKDAIEKENEEFEKRCANENVDVKLCDEKCTYMSLQGDKIYLIKGTKVSTLDINTDEFEDIDFLKDYDVEEMYVINGKVIYFRCGGNVYQADLENKSVFDLEKENVRKFFPTKYGILYYYDNKEINDEDFLDIYTDDKMV